MKRLTFLIFSLFLMMASSPSGAQALLTRDDSIRVKKDTTIQLIVKDFRGSIQWQESQNYTTWINLKGKISNTLIVQPDHEASYRAMIKEGTCNPLYSDSVVIVFLKATVSTKTVTDITPTTASGGGDVTTDGGDVVTQRGVCWSILPEPTVAGNKTINGSGTGNFTGSVTGLTPNTPYFLRAYATNSKGTAYGSQVSFTTFAVDTNLVTDTDGNLYSTIKIGSQIWMKDNLRVTHAPDGAVIATILCDSLHEKTVGRHYSWDVAMNGSTVEKSQGICPKGWHIPSDEEVKLLEIFLGMSRSVADLDNTWRGAPVGTLLKAGGSSGFELPLAGLAFAPGSCYNVEKSAYLWTSTAFGEGNAWRRCFDTSGQVGRWNTWPKSYGLSIRCIKN